MTTKQTSKESADISLVGKFIMGLPVALPAGVAAFGVVAVVLLLLNQFQGILIWTIGPVVTLITMALVLGYYRSDRPGNIREQYWCDVLIIVGVLAWILFNSMYTSQHVFTNRDPATYANAGVWLAHHDDLRIDVPTAFGEVDGVKAASAGFHVKEDGDQVYAQGQHLLPALLGAAGKIIGDSNLLHLNVLFGGTALLAIYAFARMLVRPRWALIAVGVMAVSLPFIYFSRDTYTEPLMATFIFGSLALLWSAQQKRKLMLWFLAGLVAGAATLARVDAYLGVAALAAFAVVWLATRLRRERGQAVGQITALAAGIGLVAIIGWLDVTQLSPLYYVSHAKFFHQAILATVAVLAIGIVVILLSWRTNILKSLDAFTKEWRGSLIAILLLAFAAFLASRPLWYVSYISQQGEVTAILQKAAGYIVEPRNYAELTTNWVAWYIGIPMAIFGVIGIALAAGKVATKRDLLLLAGLLTVVSVSLVYFINPSITPDQIWASRRFLPVIFPGLVIFGVFALDRIYAKYLSTNFLGKIAALFLVVAMVAAPLLTTWPFLQHRDTAQLAAIKDVCNALPDNAAVLWTGMARLEAVQPTRGYCGVPAMGYVDDSPSADTIAQVSANAKEQGYTPIIGVYGRQAGLIDSIYRGNLNSYELEYQELEQTLTRPPQTVEVINESLLLGAMHNDGSIKKL